MPTTLQFRRGTEAQNDAFTGSAGEITFDTTNKTLRAHDGSTAGGSTLATETYVDNAVGSLSADSISNGTSTVTVVASGGNVRANVGGSTVALFTSTGLTITGAVTADSFVGIDADKITNGTSNVAVASNSDVTVTVGGATAATFASSGLTVAGNLTVNGTTTTINSTTLTVDDKTIVIASGSADGAAADGAGISVDGAGATFTYANSGDKWVANKSIEATSFIGEATSAQYADLAEKYESDRAYEPGTVIVIGGSKEVSQSTRYADSAVVGVVSTNPAHLMNSDLTAEYTIDLALTGRVPCKVVGYISKGDVLTTSNLPGVATKLDAGDFVPGCVIGKALENYNSEEVGVIEILVGKS